MEPVVNGLEQNFQDSVEFRHINANTPVGKAVYQTYRLRGHPAYVLLNPKGEVIWSSLGEQSEQSLEQQIRIALNAP
jgi:hypothetical protein